MPAYGLIKDSPIIYYGRRASRAFRKIGRSGSSRVNYGGSLIGQTLNYTLTSVNIYDSVLLPYLNTQAGPLWRELDRRAERAKRGAQNRVGFKTGKLKASIYKRHLGNVTGQYITIGSKVSYALAHHEGTRPHTIKAKNDGVLVFSKGSRVIRTPEVNHPGTRPNRFLSSQLYHFKFQLKQL